MRIPVAGPMIADGRTIRLLFPSAIIDCHYRKEAVLLSVSDNVFPHLSCERGTRFLLSRVEWRRYRDIIVYRTRAELKAEAELNHMGYVWWLLEPLLNTVLFYTILVVVLDRPRADSISFVLVASITWQWFNGTVMSTAGSIFDAGGILKQVYLPKVVLPMISILSNAWKFLFIFLILLLWLWGAGSPPNIAYASLPVLLLLEFAVILALSLPLAAVIPYFPDARVAVDAVLRSLMLVSGFFFTGNETSGRVPALFLSEPDGGPDREFSSRADQGPMAGMGPGRLCGAVLRGVAPFHVLVLRTDRPVRGEGHQSLNSA